MTDILASTKTWTVFAAPFLVATCLAADPAPRPLILEPAAFRRYVETFNRDDQELYRGEESRLPKRHLIAQNVANFRLPVHDRDLVAEAEIAHFHYAYPEAVDWNRGLDRVIGCDETGFAGRKDETYRRQRGHEDDLNCVILDHLLERWM